MLFRNTFPLAMIAFGFSACAAPVAGTKTTVAASSDAAFASLDWSPYSKNFGTVAVGSHSSAQIFTFTNSGTGNATGCRAPELTHPENFTIISDFCGTISLAAGASCTITIVGSPIGTGLKSTTLLRGCESGGGAFSSINQIQVTGI